MKKLIKAVSLFCLLMLMLTGMAQGREWPMYEEFFRVNGESIDKGEIDSDSLSKLMLLCVVQKDEKNFDRIFNRLFKKREDGRLYLASYDTSGEALFTAYTCLEAAEIFSREELKQRGVEILSNVLEQYTYTSKILGTVLLPHRTDTVSQGRITLRPSDLPVFIFQRLAKENADIAMIARNTFHCIVRGSGDGIVADAMVLDTSGSTIVGRESTGTLKSAPFYLWLGLTSSADPNRRILMPLYENIIDYTSYDLTSPALSNLFYHTQDGEGELLFDSCMLPLVEGKVKDYLRTRIKNHVFTHKESRTHIIAMYALGYDERRVNFNADGTLSITEL